MRVMRWLASLGWRMCDEMEHEKRARLAREFEERRAMRRNSQRTQAVELTLAHAQVLIRVPDRHKRATIG